MKYIIYLKSWKHYYREARNGVSVGAHTSSVLACRKLLMNIAVNQGAEAGKSFISYVDVSSR